VAAGVLVEQVRRIHGRHGSNRHEDGAEREEDRRDCAKASCGSHGSHNRTPASAPPQLPISTNWPQVRR
jgi:hypothetical protein